LTPEELHSIHLECYLDPTLYARTFKRKAFEYPMSWVHRGMLALLIGRADFLLNFGLEEWPKSTWDWNEAQLEKILKYFVYQPAGKEPVPLFFWDRELNRISMTTSRFIALMLPRGVGKTTIVNLANEISIVYKDTKFLVYVSETATHSIDQLGTIKGEFENNDLLREVFGNLKGDRSTGLSWTEDYIELTNGVVALARGRGGQIRGLNVDFQRPDTIIVDDVEDDESVSTEEQLRKAKVWFFKSLVPALPEMSGEGRIIALGTLLSPHALLMDLTKDLEWVSVVFGTLDPEGEPVAPFYLGKAGPEAIKVEYQRKRLIAAGRNMLTEFEMEYGSRIFQEEGTRKFNPDKIKVQVMTRVEFLGVAEVIDPAISEDRKADYTSVAIVGMTERGQLHVLDLYAEIGMSPRAQVDKFFDMHFQWNPTHHGVETIAYQAALRFLLIEEMARRAQTKGSRAFFEITKITHGRTRKETRIEGILSPRYASGYITHQKNFPEIIVQMRDWGVGGKKDCLDAISMAVALLDPFAMTASSSEEEDEDGILGLHQDSYLPLELEIGEWRNAP
jgi:hypothetical protein